MLILGGLLSVVFGLIVLFAPGPGALGLIWAIASYSASCSSRLRCASGNTATRLGRPWRQDRAAD
jgi:hypothetical protein